MIEARPGNYRGHTINVGSFNPNRFGLYDMHGNVNEWCFDFYAPYNINENINPVGPSSGTRHVYRGGGWNDFAKNMRSAYRAAADDSFKSYNLGMRLVRNATIKENAEIKISLFNNNFSNKKILIAYFSWSGNTRGIANEIQNQIGVDIFEISPMNVSFVDFGKREKFGSDQIVYQKRKHCYQDMRLEILVMVLLTTA